MDLQHSQGKKNFVTNTRKIRETCFLFTLKFTIHPMKFTLHNHFQYDFGEIMK